MHAATRMLTIRRVVRSAHLMVLTLLFGAPAIHAQQGHALPVGVSFEFSEPKVVHSFDSTDNPSRLEGKITAQFISSLQSRFNYWTFATASGETNVVLKLGLEETTGGALALWLRLVKGSQIVKRWDATAMLPGEKMASGYPKGEKWVTKLQPIFEGQLLEQKNQEILDLLMNQAPVGKETIFMPPTSSPDVLPRAVLALDSSQYEDLSECGFKIRYNWTTAGGVAIIHASGIGMHVPYPPSAPPYDGIVVQLEEFWQAKNKLTINQLVQNLPNLSPVEFYLETIKGPGSE